MSAQQPEAVAPQVGDTLTVTGVVKRVSVTGHMALVEITGGTIWVPLAGEGRMLDPAVVRLQVGEQQDVIAEVLAGHPIWQWSDDGHVFVGCRCTGCVIVRAAGLWPSYRGNPIGDQS